MDDSHVSRVDDDFEVCGAEESDNNEDRDRLSELPDPIIHSILSLLPMKDVVGTTFLSKRWNHLWATIPCLDFCGNTYQFRDLVNGIIALWKGTKILKFKLVFKFSPYHTSDLDSWLLLAIDKEVEELHLDLNYGLKMYMNRKYYPPPALYSCSSIKNLTLVGCSLNIGKNVHWNQLESLTIDAGERLSENAIDDILYNAPRLESLDLRILGPGFNIQSSSLKKLKIERRPNDEENEWVLRICAPNLESLEMLGVPCRRCLLSVPSLTKAILGFKYSSAGVLHLEMWSHLFESLNHVEDITLTHWCIEVLLELKEKDTLVSFSDAKLLTLYTDESDEILGVVEMFPQLMMLVVKLDELLTYELLNFTGYTFDHVQPSICNFDSSEASPCPLLHLRTVEITWFMPDLSVLDVIEIILKNAKKLEKMVFQPATFEIGNQGILSMVRGKLLSMPVASPTAQVFIKKGVGKKR